jgi:hypothetical protein
MTEDNMKNISLLVLIVLSLLTTACSHTPKRSDKMLAYSEHAQSLGKQWDEGNKMILDGKSLKDKGTALIRDGQNQIAKGNSLINEGSKNITNGHNMLLDAEKLIEKGMMAKKESEITFKNQFPSANIYDN